MIKLSDILKERGITKGAFHGFGMEPKDMRMDVCNVEWTSPDQETGCPSFSDSNKITEEDIQKAMNYLNEENLNTLIAYSRGGAILLQALSLGAKRPSTVYLVAPAWKRKWPTVTLTGSEISGNGFIIHGGSDDVVPLVHSVILSQKSGMPLYIFPDMNHVNILKNKENPTSGKQLKDLQKALDTLPDWGQSAKATPEQLKIQSDFVKNIQ